MSKTIFIGGRLESKEKGNVVAGANAILDDTKGKKQNVINKETDDELLRLEQSKQDNLTFDNAPTEDSTNPVTSGGIYTAEKALSDAIEAILLLIPSAATALNKLVDTNTMNSSISTATATFRGTYNAVTDLGLTYQATHAQIEAALDALGLAADNNDYAFVQVPVSDQSQDIAKTERYKNNGTNWQYEYDLNTSGFTSQQWAAINSGITVALVTKLTDLPTAAALQLALNAKQDVLTFDTEPTALSQNPVTSGGIFTAIQAIATALSDYSTTTDDRLGVLEGLIPSEAASNNKLTDKAYVDGLIQAITELIPAEATTSNQLADKAYVLASILAATPAFKGQFTTLAELQAIASPKDGDLGIVRTKDSDGMDVFTVYQYLNNAWGVFYSLSYHPQTKPATTGTTGDYPYNGMGRVELAKNMVNTGTELAPVYENQLTQDMFYKGAVDSRTPNTNTIFVIRYDYVLAENITIPDGCVLEFEGGSISGEYTLTGANTGIKADLVKIFDATITLAGIWNTADIYDVWFDTSLADNSGVYLNLLNLLNDDIYNILHIEKELNITPENNTYFVKSNTKIVISGKITAINSTLVSYQLIQLRSVSNIEICGGGSIIGDKDNPRTEDGQWGHCIMLQNCTDITIHDLYISKAFGDGVSIAQWQGHDSLRTTNIKCYNLTIDDCWRQGISITNGDNIIIENCVIKNINGHSPSAAIDVEAEPYMSCTNITIGNCLFKDTLRVVHFKHNGSSMTTPEILAATKVDNLYVYNCKVENSLANAADMFEITGDNAVFDNIDVKYTGSYSSTRNAFVIPGEYNVKLTVRNSSFDLNNAFLLFYLSSWTESKVTFDNCIASKTCGVFSKNTSIFMVSNSKIEGPICIYGTNSDPIPSAIIENCIVDTSGTISDAIAFLKSKVENRDCLFAFNAITSLVINNVLFIDKPSSARGIENFIEIPRCRYVQIKASVDNADSYTSILKVAEYQLMSEDNILNADLDLKVAQVVQFVYINSKLSEKSVIKINRNSSQFSGSKACRVPSGMYPKIEMMKNAYDSQNLPDVKESFLGNSIMLEDTGKPAWYNGTAWVDGTGTPV